MNITSGGDRFKVNANRFRLAIGPNIIRSTNFKIRLAKRNGLLKHIFRDQAYFTGYGWGHGVGMCQWGAFFMSKKHFNAEQILNYYYPESKIKRIEEIQDAKRNVKTF